MTTLAKTDVGALEGSLGVGEPPRPSNPDPVEDKRLFFMTLFKTVAQMPCLRRYGSAHPPPPPPGTKTRPNETLKRLKLK